MGNGICARTGDVVMDSTPLRPQLSSSSISSILADFAGVILLQQPVRLQPIRQTTWFCCLPERTPPGVALARL